LFRKDCNAVVPVVLPAESVELAAAAELVAEDDEAALLELPPVRALSRLLNAVLSVDSVPPDRPEEPVDELSSWLAATSLTRVFSALIKPCCAYWLIALELPYAVPPDALVVLVLLVAVVASLGAVVSVDALVPLLDVGVLVGAVEGVLVPLVPLPAPARPLAWRSAPNRSCRKACKSCPTAALDVALLSLALVVAAPAAVPVDEVVLDWAAA